MKPWSEKYKPKTADEMLMSPSFKKLSKVVEEGGVALVYGPTGSGKTCSVEVIAKDGDYELLEMNASDFRNADKINRIVGENLEQQSLFAKKKLILIDEINGIVGTEDRGGVQALARLLSKNKFPIVLTAEDPWNSKLNVIKKKSELIEFQPVDYLGIAMLLGRICQEEKVEYKEDDLKVIARRVGGDVRAAINDLQIHACNGKLEIEEASNNERGRESNIVDALKVVLKSNKWDNVLGVYDNVKEDHKEILLWLDQNLPYEYNIEELNKAYEILSKADVFNRRIMRWQHWRYLVYIYLLLSEGVALSKDDIKKGFVPYKRSSRPLKIWMGNQKNFKGKVMAERLAHKFHTSKKGFIKQDLPYLRLMARHDKLPDLKFEKEEIEWLKK